MATIATRSSRRNNAIHFNENDQSTARTFGTALDRFRNHNTGIHNDSHTYDPPKSGMSPEYQPSRSGRSLRPSQPTSTSPSTLTSTPTSASTSTFTPTPTSASSSTTLGRKRKRTASSYAPPSVYAHLPHLRDVLAPNLIAIFIGNNPGLKTASSGHAYAHPSNLFWKLLHESGCTDRRCRPEEDGDLPRLFALGNTNLVSRPSRNTAELSKSEMSGSTPCLEKKIRDFRPEAVCVVGKGIWEAIYRYKHGKGLQKATFEYGWQRERLGVVEDGTDEDGASRGENWGGAWVYVASSTSGLSASTSPAEKIAIWKPFGEWVAKRRQERMEAQGPHLTGANGAVGHDETDTGEVDLQRAKTENDTAESTEVAEVHDHVDEQVDDETSRQPQIASQLAGVVDDAVHTVVKKEIKAELEVEQHLGSITQAREMTSILPDTRGSSKVTKSLPRVWNTTTRRWELPKS